MEESSSIGVVNQSVETVGGTEIDTSDGKVEERGLLITTSPTVREEGEDPQGEETQHLIGDDSSLLQIMTTYSDDEE